MPVSFYVLLNLLDYFVTSGIKELKIHQFVGNFW